MNNQPAGSNQYDFIMNPPQQDGKKPRFAGTSPTTKRLLIVVFALIILAILAVVVVTILGSVDRAVKADWQKALQQQAEIIRVSDIGVEKAQGSEAKNLAINTKLSLTSSQTSLSSLASKSGVKPDPKQIKAGVDEKTDLRLTQAEQINQFDDAFIQTIKSKLTEYQSTLKRLHQATGSSKTKDELNKINQGVVLLITSK